MASVQKVRLMSSDGVSFEMDVDAALKSQLLKFMMEDTNCGEDVIPIPNVTANILSKVIEYCNKHVHGDDLHKEWDSEFVKVDQATLYGLLMAANYLDIKSLLDLICETVVDMIKGKTPEEIRGIFNINNDFTPEEEEQLRKEYQWAFEI